MPAVTKVFFYSDLDWPDAEVPADEVVRLTISWVSVDGDSTGREDVELYLTAAGREQLVKGNGSWLELGHRPGRKPGAGEPKKRSRAYGGSREEALDHWRDLRENFVDPYDLRSRKNPEQAAYMNPSGKWYYYKWVRDLYAEWLAAGRPAPGAGWEPPQPKPAKQKAA